MLPTKSLKSSWRICYLKTATTTTTMLGLELFCITRHLIPLSPTLVETDLPLMNEKLLSQGLAMPAMAGTSKWAGLAPGTTHTVASCPVQLQHAY